MKKSNTKFKCACGCDEMEFVENFNGFITTPINGGTIDYSGRELDGDTDNQMIICCDCGKRINKKLEKIILHKKGV